VKGGVQCKPPRRRHSRATLAYDRVMFFSDFFRRLESDRRLFALSPVDRNRVYVCPRSDDDRHLPPAAVAPVKFPRPVPVPTKKGRIGIVAATVASVNAANTRSSPFHAKRRLPTHRWDHKIDLESIEADATSTAQPSRHQLHSMNHQLIALSHDRPKESPTRRIYQERETTKGHSKKVPHGAANAVDNAESAFVGVTKHSAKMRRRLKRKQRKRSVNISEGNDGDVQDTSSTGSEEGTPVRRVHRATDVPRSTLGVRLRKSFYHLHNISVP